MEYHKSYEQRITRHTPHSYFLKDFVFAFVVGGTICLLGEIIANICLYFGIKSEDAYTWVTIILIFISALLTGMGVFDKIARFAGAGTLVPVSGFANSVVSPAIDTKSEGYVLGVGAKIFTVAGPVILYATLAGALYGIIYYVVNLFL